MYDRDMLFLQLLMGNRGHWPLILLIGGIFLIIALKREAIVYESLFRLGVVLVASSMLVSPFLSALQMENFPTRGQELQTGNLILNSVEPVLLSLALVCIVFSMLPMEKKASNANPKPVTKKHPLDD